EDQRRRVAYDEAAKCDVESELKGPPGIDPIDALLEERGVLAERNRCFPRAPGHGAQEAEVEHRRQREEDRERQPQIGRRRQPQYRETLPDGAPQGQLTCRQTQRRAEAAAGSYWAK